MHLSLTFLKVHNVKDPYSFFIRVVSQTSNPDGILAWLQFGLPRKEQDYKKNAALCKHIVLEAFLLNSLSILPADIAV